VSCRGCENLNLLASAHSCIRSVLNLDLERFLGRRDAPTVDPWESSPIDSTLHAEADDALYSISPIARVRKQARDRLRYSTPEYKAYRKALKRRRK
jgi:hypothetical protein